jgi:5-methylcytosine-specific restriction enzyme subunit McrC
MTNPPLLLTEYISSPAVELTARDAATLRRIVTTMSVAPSWDVPGTYDLTPGSEVGVVALDNRSVIIRPKVPTDRVLFLVSYALDPAHWQQRAGAYDKANDLVEGMAAVFAHELRRVLRRGLLQGYRSTEEALMTVRGRVRFDEQLRRRFGMPFPLEVRFDEYTEDTELNRVLRAALSRLSRLPIRSRQVRSILGVCSAALADTVTLVEYSHHALPQFQWDRLNQQYRIAAELALLILRSTSVELAKGRTAGTGFVIDMNVVFEEFVRTALREALGLARSAFPSGSDVSIVLDEDAKIGLEPDLSWWVGNSCVFVGDAKYKRINVKGINHPDVYQLLAYTVALGLPAGLLVYAEGEADRVVHSVLHVEKRLEVTTVDLTGSPEQILADIARIANHVKALRSPVALKEMTIAGPQVAGASTGIGRS